MGGPWESEEVWEELIYKAASSQIPPPPPGIGIKRLHWERRLAERFLRCKGI